MRSEAITGVGLGVFEGTSTGTGVGVGTGVAAVLASGAGLKRDWMEPTIRFQTCCGVSSYLNIKKQNAPSANRTSRSRNDPPQPPDFGGGGT